MCNTALGNLIKTNVVTCDIRTFNKSKIVLLYRKIFHFKKSVLKAICGSVVWLNEEMHEKMS